MIVKTVRHLMPDNRTHAAIVERVVSFRIVEGRLQDSGGKADLVELGIGGTVNVGPAGFL